MNRKSSTTLTISAVAFIAALLIDLYFNIGISFHDSGYHCSLFDCRR